VGEHASAQTDCGKWVSVKTRSLGRQQCLAVLFLEHREDGWYWENEKIDRNHRPMSIGATRKEDPSSLIASERSSRSSMISRVALNRLPSHRGPSNRIVLLSLSHRAKVEPGGVVWIGSSTISSSPLTTHAWNGPSRDGKIESRRDRENAIGRPFLPRTRTHPAIHGPNESTVKAAFIAIDKKEHRNSNQKVKKQQKSLQNAWGFWRR